MKKCNCKHDLANKLQACCALQQQVRKSAQIALDAASAEPLPLARSDLSVAARPAPVSGNAKGPNLP